ncbi:4-hydroxythreonine-4-phosphate dehydrogenase PdxA [Candidatus Pelagibacter sp.]|nr:4-hydroxythreonine-4-phosphate dehydrogenase PdxA [Candidatus Pelagibacter sp.]MDC0428752.1 4-hydroxythreonine-4-phosphate dehydrogenase PdxA [Candidatus Pelagibacter sp.]MDC1003364.1 4-hydroxythreonine-4-phosphate dehydrogenase PdxA [Candidatus Pelagibacter sp.]
MNYKPIIIVAGEPNSVFFEIFFKVIKKKIKSPIILIASEKLIIKQASVLRKKISLNLINENDVIKKKNNLKKINLINVDFKQTKAFEKITPRSNEYISSCFQIALRLIKNNISNKFINGPISKKTFLKNKFNGITEFLAKKTNTKDFAMIIYNKKLSVCPLTTHLPIKYVSKRINKLELIKKVRLVDKFWKIKFNKKIKIGVTGLNPHCESIDSFNEDKSIIYPTIKKLKKLKYDIQGPLAADTIFLKNNRKKFNLIIGMYHDQVLAPIKTLFEYEAINITIGLPFIRVSPDHGPNESMLGKNKSNHLSLHNSIKFLDF